MKAKRKMETFSAGCPACEEAVEVVKQLACASCEIDVLDMHQTEVATKAAQYGVRGVPSVVIDGTLADCCAGRGVEAAPLRAAGVGVAL